jgi:hypothetical protein
MNADHGWDKIRQKGIIIMGEDFISYYYVSNSSSKKIRLNMCFYTLKCIGSINWASNLFLTVNTS